MVTRVLASFTDGHYFGNGERPNTKLADNSLFANRSIYIKNKV
jgi:hypothetical protein